MVPVQNQTRNLNQDLNQNLNQDLNQDLAQDLNQDLNQTQDLNQDLNQTQDLAQELTPPHPLTVGGVDPQVDGHWADSFVGSGHSVRFSFDLLTNFIKVGELLAFAVQELSVLCRADDQSVT